MSENFDSQVVDSENIPAQQKISFIENFKTRFFSITPSGSWGLFSRWMVYCSSTSVINEVKINELS